MLSREQALELIRAQTPEDHMLTHALESEAVMRALAQAKGQDPELWGMTGLLHDLDYPHTAATPERHGLRAAELIGDGLPPEAVHAIKAHNEECTGVKAAGDLDFALRAAETVTGLVHTAALVRPTRMEGMLAKSLKKKMKDKSFAAAVSRERIQECEKLGIELGEFLTLAIAAITAIAPDVGLAAE